MARHVLVARHDCIVNICNLRPLPRILKSLILGAARCDPAQRETQKYPYKLRKRTKEGGERGGIRRGGELEHVVKKNPRRRIKKREREREGEIHSSQRESMNAARPQRRRGKSASRKGEKREKNANRARNLIIKRGLKGGHRSRMKEKTSGKEEEAGGREEGESDRRYRVGKYLSRPRIVPRAPACTCGCACIQTTGWRPRDDDKRSGGVVGAPFNPGIPSSSDDDGSRRWRARAALKPSLPTSTPRAENLPLRCCPGCPFPSLPPPHAPRRGLRPSIGGGGSSRAPARAG